jgi:hypothetical protein
VEAVEITKRDILIDLSLHSLTTTSAFFIIRKEYKHRSARTVGYFSVVPSDPLEPTVMKNHKDLTRERKEGGRGRGGFGNETRPATWWGGGIAK